MAGNAELEARLEAVEKKILNAVLLPKDILDYSGGNDMTNRWVIGSGVPGIVGGGAWLGFSTVETPTQESELSTILAAK